MNFIWLIIKVGTRNGLRRGNLSRQKWLEGWESNLMTTNDPTHHPWPTPTIHQNISWMKFIVLRNWELEIKIAKRFGAHVNFKWTACENVVQARRTKYENSTGMINMFADKPHVINISAVVSFAKIFVAIVFH